jgi:hypothetical protein
MPTGPSPAFEASLLEVESDFRNVLARLEAARGRAEMQAIDRGSPDPDPTSSASAEAPGSGSPAASPEP